MKSNDLHTFIDEELESRIVALVLGESSDFERHQLEKKLAIHPELEAYRGKIAAIHGAVSTLSRPESEAEVEAWRMNGDRRAEILAKLRSNPGSDEKVSVHESVPSSPRLLSRRWVRATIVAGAAAACVIATLNLGLLHLPQDRMQIAQMQARPVAGSESASTAPAADDLQRYSTADYEFSPPEEEAESIIEPNVVKTSPEYLAYLFQTTDELDLDAQKIQATEAKLGDISLTTGGEADFAMIGHGGSKSESDSFGTSIVGIDDLGLPEIEKHYTDAYAHIGHGGKTVVTDVDADGVQESEPVGMTDLSALLSEGITMGQSNFRLLLEEESELIEEGARLQASRDGLMATAVQNSGSIRATGADESRGRVRLFAPENQEKPISQLSIGAEFLSTDSDQLTTVERLSASGSTGNGGPSRSMGQPCSSPLSWAKKLWGEMVSPAPKRQLTLIRSHNLFIVNAVILSRNVARPWQLDREVRPFSSRKIKGSVP